MNMSEENMDAEDLAVENADQHARGEHKGESVKHAHECRDCRDEAESSDAFVLTTPPLFEHPGE